MDIEARIGQILSEELGYSRRAAELTARDLTHFSAPEHADLDEAVARWVTDRGDLSELACGGYCVRDLMAHGMSYPAALVFVDWCRSDPATASRALAERMWRAMTYEDALRLVNRETWSKLSEEGKVAVLQTIENEAAAEAGRPARTVAGKWLYAGDDGIELGRYQNEDKTVYVNSSQLAEGSLYGDNPDKMVETVLHEGRHALQRDASRVRCPTTTRRS